MSLRRGASSLTTRKPDIRRPPNTNVWSGTASTDGAEEKRCVIQGTQRNSSAAAVSPIQPYRGSRGAEVGPGNGVKLDGNRGLVSWQSLSLSGKFRRAAEPAGANRQPAERVRKIAAGPLLTCAIGL